MTEDLLVESHKRKQNEGAPEKVRFKGGINLFFHCDARLTFGNLRKQSAACSGGAHRILRALLLDQF